MRKQKIGVSHSVSGVFVFLLVGLFAVSALMLTLIGTRVYRNVNEAGTQNSQSQLLVSYLGNKLRSYDACGSVAVESRDGLSVLRLSERLDGEAYETLIYGYDGAVYEQLVPTGQSFSPEDGQRIAEVESLSFALSDDGLATLSVVEASGKSRTLHVALRSAQEGGL